MDRLGFASLALLALSASACGGTNPPTQEDDLAGYETLKTQLEGHRSELLTKPAQDFQVSESLLFYVTNSGGNPFLESYDDGTGKTVTYGFKPYLTGVNNPNPVDNINYVATGQIIASMNELDGASTYKVGEANAKLGKLTLPAPPYGQKWWEYTADGAFLYVAVAEADNTYHVKKWKQGDSASVDVAVLDDLIAPNQIGELQFLGVTGSRLYFMESGRVWFADLPATKAKWIENQQRPSALGTIDAGITYSIDRELYLRRADSGATENLSDKIRANAYQLNSTFKECHHPGAVFSYFGRGDRIYYIGNCGLFRYELGADKVTPLLLDARDNSIVYRTPQALAGGKVVVKGLQSTSGATGADGPMYLVAN